MLITERDEPDEENVRFIDTRSVHLMVGGQGWNVFRQLYRISWADDVDRQLSEKTKFVIKLQLTDGKQSPRKKGHKTTAFTETSDKRQERLEALTET